MTKQELMEKLGEVGTCTDDAARRSMLTTISDEIGLVFDANHTLTEANEKLTKDNDTLRGYNMELFQRVGAPVTKTKEKEQPEEMKYSDLFNEKGELK